MKKVRPDFSDRDNHHHCSKVVVVSPFRQHMFELGAEMVRRNWSLTLVTATPRWKIDKDIAPYAQTEFGVALALAVMNRLSRYGLKIPPRYRLPVEHLARVQFARAAARHLDGAQIVDALSGWGIECGIEARRRGIEYVCNRGSTHILWQEASLKEEFAQSGIKLPDFVSWGLIRELAEYELADAIAVPSQFVRRTFIQYGVPESKLFVCPYGVDLSLYRKEPKLDDRFRILFVGSASIQKGLRYLFEAVRPLVQRNLVELWLVGDIRNEVKDLCRKNCDLYTFKGFIPRAHLSSMYSQGSVLVLPSVDEGFGMVMAQAMACGVPVIATHNTGAEDLFEDGCEGFIVPPRDAAAIRDRIEWMIDHPTARLEMAERAMKRVSALNGWEGYGERVNSMYTTLLGSSVGEASVV